MAEKLNGTVALVTGASSGIGEAAAAELARRGATVAVVARRKDRLEALVERISADNGKALALDADITIREQAVGVVERTVAEFGRLDTLVNSAGVMLNHPTLDQPLEEWELTIDLNLKALMVIAKTAIPHLLKAVESNGRGLADLINVSSISGRTAFPEVAAYNASKFGVSGFTESLRQEFTERSLRVSVIEPGAVETELFGHLSQHTQDKYAPGFKTIEKLQAEDVADLIGYMVSSPRRVCFPEVIIRPTDHVL